MKLIALCLGGLEPEVLIDLEFHLPKDVKLTILPASHHATDVIMNNRRVNKGEAGCGKILIENVNSFEFIGKVRSVQYWLVYITYIDKLPSKKEDNFNLIDSSFPNMDFDSSYQNWLNVVSTEFVPNYKSLKKAEEQPSFCVRCVRDGTHPFSSMEIAKKIGDVVNNKTNWKVDLSNMDLEIVTLICNEQLLLGINIPTESRPFQSSRLPREIKKPIINSPTSPSLRPSTAYMMLKLLNPQPGEILVDCMCGTGSIFIEAAYSFGCIAIGGDVDKSLKNLLLETKQLASTMSKNKTITEPTFWSANKLPVVDQSVDLCLLDFPFSKMGNHVPKYFTSKPYKYVEELTRILRLNSGRCIFMTQNYQLLSSCLDSKYFISDKRRIIPINIGGYIGYLVIAYRSDIPLESKQIIMEETREDFFSKKRKRHNNDYDLENNIEK